MNQNQTNESEIGKVNQNQKIQLDESSQKKFGNFTMEELIRYYNDVLFGNAINAVSFENPFDAIAQSTYCGIKDSIFSVKLTGEVLIGIRQKESFEVILGTQNGKEISFFIKEKSDKFERFCVEKPKRKFELSFYYNKNKDPKLSPVYDYSKSFINVIRIEGGFCSSRQEVSVISPYTQQTIGRIVVHELVTNVYDSNDNLKYIIKFYYPLTKETCCCLCCAKTRYVRREQEPYASFDFKIYQNNQEVGEIRGIPYKIIFPLQASVEDKILIIVARIFITYIVDPFGSTGPKCIGCILENCPCGLCFKCCL